MTDQLAALRMLVAAKQAESEKLSNQALEDFINVGVMSRWWLISGSASRQWRRSRELCPQ